MAHNNNNKINRKVISSRKRLGWKEKDYDKPTRRYDKITPEEERLLKRNGISKQTFANRRYKGWSREKALNTKVRRYQRLTDEEKDLMKQNGVDETTFRTRISRNMNRIDAASTPKKIPKNNQNKDV